MKKKLFIFILMAILLVIMAGCAPGPNPAVNTPDEQGSIGGVWLGLWHGIIAPVTLIFSVFDASVHMYDVHNDGGWYNLGFLLGIGVFFGALWAAGEPARRRTRR
jgi:hypothetical protein